MKRAITVFTVSLALAFFHPVLVQKVLSEESDFDWEAEIQKIPQGVTSRTNSQQNADSTNEEELGAEENPENIQLPSLSSAIDEAVTYYYKDETCLAQNFEFFKLKNIRYYIPSTLRCQNFEPPPIDESGAWCSTSWGIYGTDRVCFSHHQGLDAALGGRDWNSPLPPGESN